MGRAGALRLTAVSHACVVPSNQEIYRALVERGVEVTLLVPDHWRHLYDPSPLRPVPIAGMEGRLETFRIVGAGKPQRFSPTQRPGSLLARARPDVVAIEEEPFSVAGALFARAAWRMRVPFGVQVAENMDRPLPRPARRWRTTTLERASFVMARSSAAMSRAREWGASGAVELIAHGVDAWEVPDHRVSDAFTIGYLGRLVEEKGLTELVTAVEMMEPAPRLVLIGDGPLAEQLGRSARVELRAPIDHDAVPEAMADFDVLALPSRTTPTWTEQFGRVIVEALMCGVPVVGASTGEIPWLLARTGGGVVVPERDPKALADALAALRDDPERRAELAVRGRAAVEEEFTVDAVADRFVEVLEQARGAERSP